MAKDEKTTNAAAADKGKGKAVDTPDKKDAPADGDKKGDKNGAAEGGFPLEGLSKEAC